MSESNTLSVSELKAKLAELKAQEKAARAEEAAKKNTEKAEKAALRDQLLADLKVAKQALRAKKDEYEQAKQAVKDIVAKLPKGTKAGVSGENGASGKGAYGTSPIGGRFGLRTDARAVLDVLSKLKSKAGLSRKAVAAKAGEMGYKLHHSGRINNEAPTFKGLLEGGLISSQEIAPEDNDGKKETTYTITDQGREALKAAKEKIKATQKATAAAANGETAE